jgi:hypothetical protein
MSERCDGDQRWKHGVGMTVVCFVREMIGGGVCPPDAHRLLLAPAFHHAQVTTRLHSTNGGLMTRLTKRGYSTSHLSPLASRLLLSFLFYLKFCFSSLFPNVNAVLNPKL